MSRKVFGQKIPQDDFCVYGLSLQQLAGPDSGCLRAEGQGGGQGAPAAVESNICVHIDTQ